MVIVITGHNY